MEPQDTNSTSPQTGRQLVIRIGNRHLSFTTLGDGGTADYNPYQLNGGISLAANMREAIKNGCLGKESFEKTSVLVDSPVLLIPTDFYSEEEEESFYRLSFPDSKGEALLHDEMSELSAVALYAINKDLMSVISGNFPDVRFFCSMSPVWRHFHMESYAGMRKKLFCYFHDGCLEIFSFGQKRFRFSNRFDVSNTGDALYFLLYTWKQLALDQENDELHIAGDIPDEEAFVNEIRTYISRSYTTDAATCFGQSPATMAKDMPFDLVTYIVRGR